MESERAMFDESIEYIIITETVWVLGWIKSEDSETIHVMGTSLRDVTIDKVFGIPSSVKSWYLHFGVDLTLLKPCIIPRDKIDLILCHRVQSDDDSS